MKRLGLAVCLAAFVGPLTGCGTDTATPATACASRTLNNSNSAGSNFTLSPVNAMLTVYPGETTTVAVNVNPVNGSTGTVSLSAATLPQGLTLTGGTATIGSTANATLTASNDVVNACFTGVYGVWDADRTLTLNGSNSSGTASAQWNVNVVLENKTFEPAKNFLPVLKITTTGGAAVTSKDDYVTAAMTITDTTTPANNYSGTLGIKGHGNSTWGMPKKPYRLNLDSKAPLLGMTSNSNWILLANYDDKTMLRNDVSFKMSDLFGMAWTPNSMFVEMYMNGEYEGVYELSEKVEVSKSRLNIGSMDPTDISGTNLTRGYLAEIDHYEDATYVLPSLVGLPIALDDPDPPAIEQQNYFTTAFQAAEGSMYNDSNWTSPTAGWQAYWDASSVVNWFLIEELADNSDANDYSSDYLYKPRSDPKFYRGPVWDMDITFGNSENPGNVDPTQPWVAVQSLWYRRLFQDPAFVALVKARWQAERANALALLPYLDSRQAALESVQANNFARWPNLGEKVWPNPVARGSFDAEVAAMKAWLTARIAYMDATYGN